MVYKKYIVKDGKTYGPYVYHSHRVDGKVVSDYHGNSLKKRRHFILGGMIFLISLIIILAVVQLTPKESFNFTINSKSLNGISNSAKVIPQEQVKNLGNSILKFIGFATEEGEISDDSDSSESSSDINSEEASEEETEISSEEVVAPEENSVEEETSESITLEEIPVEETTTETSEEETEIPAEETQEEINETSEETQTEVNETITEESISGELSNNTTSEEETEVNETITEETQKNNISSFDTNNSDVPVNNESINTTASETNETIVSNKTTDSIIVPIINETENTQQNETTKQFKAVIGKPVKWIKTITINSSEDSLVELPKQAENITIKTGDEIASALEQVGEYENLVENSDRQDIVSGGITGFVSSDIKNNLGLFNKILVWFRSLSLTGNAISEEEISNDITETADNTIVDVSNVVSEENVEEIAIEYYTEAPQAIETEKPNGKEITISAADELNYTEILAYTLISEDYGIKDESSIKLLWKNENSLSVNFDAYDLDNNGILDYIEWIVPHLSNQTYELIIEISDAQHLDENRVFIENIFPLVELRDNNYSLIPKEHYVRVSFKQNLTNKNDITIYARGNGSSVLVYEKDLDVEIARFENIIEDKKYQILLTNLSEDYSQDTFDLRSVGDVEYDYIVDPVTKLNDTDLIADVLYFNAAQSYGNQMMFNISSIPDTNTVTHAQVCLYEYTAEGALDNRVTYWFINNNTWAESISATQLNAMTGLNATNTTLSAGVLSWTCFNVTEIVGMAHINQTGLFSIRFEHPSFMVGTASNLLDTQSLTIGGDEGGGIYATRGFEDNENFGGTGNYPYLNVTSVPAPIDLTLEDLASDVGYKYNWGMGYDYGSQVKFNITQLGTGVNISQASLCLYIVEKLEDMGLDDDVSVWYISDQDWTEASSAATLDAQVITNNTNTTFSSSAKNTWGCFNITNQLKESLSKGDKNLSIRFEDGDNRVTTFDGINNALEIGFLASGSYSLYRFEDGENTNETGNAPYINISYGSTSDTTAPNLNITYPVNATTYSVNISNLNYTYSDSSSGYCWYSTDMGVTNSTSVVAGINFTLITSVEGQNNWTLYCNNSLNNLNSTRITFTKDTITQKITLNGSDNLADLGYANFWGMDGYNYGSQIKFNISTIESGANISDGTLCFYVVEKLVDTALDDDVSVWYINDQDWTDLTEYEALAAQSRLNNTNTTLSSSDKNTWACFNVTSQLQQSFLNGNKNFTIRFEDPDNLVSIIQYINSNLQIGFSDSGSYTLYRFEDGENKNESGKLPYLNVTYTSGGAVDAEYPLFFSPVETPANGSQYYPNAKYEFNISINSTNGTAGLQFNNVNYTATNLSGNRFNVTLVNIEAGNFTYQWWGKGNGTSHNPNASQLYMYTLLKNSSTSVNLTLNNTQFNITIPQNTVINLNCSLVYGDAGIRINLYNNGTLINNGTSPLYNSTNFTIDGMYNISCFYLNSQNYSGYSEIFWVNVTAVDSIAPSVTLLTESPTDPASYSLTGLGIYEFNITAIDTSSISVAKLEFNGINYTASNISNIYNVTLPINLGADVYNYSWYVNDTLGNKNNSQNGSYSVNPIAQSIIVLLNGNNANLSVIYPQQINASYNGTNATTLLIKINESVVNAGFNYTWGAGNWVVNYSISTTQNYTGFHDLLKLEINRTTSEVNLTLNNTKGNITIMNGTIIDLNCSLVNGDFGERILLYNNGTLINNGTSPLHNATNFTLVADFNITCIYELTQNYSLSSEIFWVNSTNITLGCSNTGWSDWSSWSACDAGSQYRTRIDSTGCSQSETQSCDSGGGGGDDGGDTTTITTITEPPIICTPDCSGKTCGSDGCGGSCGSCLISQTCTNGKCITPCVSDCILGQEQKECVLADSYKSRTCSDSSGCLKFGEWSSVSCKDKQKCLDGSCMACVENWVCQDWGACSKGLQTRVCSDLNICETETTKPNITQSCIEGIKIDSFPSKKSLISAVGKGSDFRIESVDLAETAEIVIRWFIGTEFQREDSGTGSLTSSFSKNFDKDAEVYAYVLVNKEMQAFLWNVKINETAKVDCESNWVCKWSDCKSGDSLSSPYDCEDLNNCGVTTDKPESKFCECHTNWECGEFGECSAKYDISDVLEGSGFAHGVQKRTCTDTLQCKPEKIEEISCQLKVPISAEKTQWCGEEYVSIYDEKKENLLSRTKRNELLKESNLERLDISLITTSFTGYCDYCFDGVKDFDEESIDCGGESCPSCLEAKTFSNWLPATVYSSWSMFILFFIFVLIFEFRNVIIAGEGTRSLLRGFVSSAKFGSPQEKILEQSVVNFFKHKEKEKIRLRQVPMAPKEVEKKYVLFSNIKKEIINVEDNLKEKEHKLINSVKKKVGEVKENIKEQEHKLINSTKKQITNLKEGIKENEENLARSINSEKRYISEKISNTKKEISRKSKKIIHDNFTKEGRHERFLDSVKKELEQRKKEAKLEIEKIREKVRKKI